MIGRPILVLNVAAKGTPAATETRQALLRLAIDAAHLSSCMLLVETLAQDPANRIHGRVLVELLVIQLADDGKRVLAANIIGRSHLLTTVDLFHEGLPG